MGKPSLVLYIDIVSPFAYLAFHVVRVGAHDYYCQLTLYRPPMNNSPM